MRHLIDILDFSVEEIDKLCQSAIRIIENPEYYKEILKKLKLEPSECIMIGNDISDDMVATEKLGMKVFLMTDCLINKKGEDISRYPRGSFAELLDYVKSLHKA